MKKKVKIVGETATKETSGQDNSTKLMFKHFINQKTEDIKTEKSVAFIKDVVAKYYNLEPSIYESKKRLQHIVKCKHIAVYLTGEFLNLKLKETAGYFWCDHATVVHAQHKITNHLSYDKELKKEIFELTEIIKNRNSELIDSALDIYKNSYFIDLSDVISMKLSKRKAVVFIGFSDDDVDNVVIKDKLTGVNWTEDKQPPRRHKDKGLFILEEEKKEIPAIEDLKARIEEVEKQSKK